MTTVEAVPQHLAALERANEIRFARAQVKRDVKAGVLSVVNALELECCETMTLLELLRAQRSWGPGRARRLLAEIPVSESKRIGMLTERQRAVVAGLLA